MCVFSFGFHDVLMGFGHGDQCTHLNFATCSEFKGQLGVPLTVYPWYLLCSLGILEDYNP